MITDKLNSKLDEAKALTKKLDRSLALEWLWPDAFMFGRARAYWFGEAKQRNVMPDTPAHLNHEYRIVDGKDNIRCYSYDEVPTILGGGLPENQWRRITNLAGGE